MCRPPSRMQNSALRTMSRVARCAMSGVIVWKATTIASRTTFSPPLRRCSIRLFICPHTKKSNTFKSDDRAGQAIGPPRPIHLSGKARLIFCALDDKNERELRRAEKLAAPVREGAHPREALAIRSR